MLLRRFGIHTREMFFPMTMSGRSVETKVSAKLDSLGLRKENTLYAESSCPDEINRVDESLSLMFQKRFGSVFQFGGLGGLPLVGPTGFDLFASHVPEGGNVFLMYASHVGWDDESGSCGHVRRRGQRELSLCSGAASEALAALKVDPNDITSGMLDHQIGIVKQLLSPSLNDIIDEDPDRENANLSFAMYHVIRLYLEQILNTNWMGSNSKLVILGGIMINRSEIGADVFQPLSFELRDRDGKKTDMFEETFGVEGWRLLPKKS